MTKLDTGPVEASAAMVDVMRRRSSWRTYDGKPVPHELRDELQAAIDTPPQGPFGMTPRLSLLEATDERRMASTLGTYGVISGAPLYMAGVIEDSGRALEDFGYAFEWAVLTATRLGLGTCWMGGTFRRSAFGEALCAGPKHVLPAVSPVGFVAGKRNAVDSVFRFFAGSKKRKPWKRLFFDDAGNQLEQSADDPHSIALEMVRIGPSASNKQPWRIVRRGDRFDLYLRRSAAYRQRFTVDLQRLDMGIAMCHFELACQAQGVAGRWRDSPSDAAESPDGADYVASWTDS